LGTWTIQFPLLEFAALNIQDLQVRGNRWYAACDTGLQILNYREGARQTITFAIKPDRFQPFVGDTVEFLPAASSGLPVEVRIVSGASTATIQGTQITFHGVGEVVIEAVQAGNETGSSSFLRYEFFVFERPELRVTYSSSTDQLELRWLAVRDPRELEWTDDLTNGTWEQLAIARAGASGFQTWVLEDSLSLPAKARFFRLVIGNLRRSIFYPPSFTSIPGRSR
jgi:hypothetical protein